MCGYTRTEAASGGLACAARFGLACCYARVPSIEAAASITAEVSGALPQQLTMPHGLSAALQGHAALALHAAVTPAAL